MAIIIDDADRVSDSPAGLARLHDLEAEGWSPSDKMRPMWEIAWSHTDGYDFVTMRVVPHHFGVWVVLMGTHGRPALNLCTLYTLSQIREVCRVLRATDYDNRGEHGDVREPS